MRKSVSQSVAKIIGVHLGIDFNTISLEQLTAGMNIELEHGTVDSQTNVTDNDLFATAKIAWAHLKELPDYYTRLEKMENEPTNLKAAL